MGVFSKKSNAISNHNPALNEYGRDTFFGVQAKLNIGKPNDKYEVEADKMADQVVKGSKKNNPEPFFSLSSSPTMNRKQQAPKENETETEVQEKQLADAVSSVKEFGTPPQLPVQKKCSACETEEKEKIQTKTTSDQSNVPTNNDNLESTLNASKGKGSRLSESVTHEMNQGFGSDFSNVNIHTDSNAVQMNQQLGSQAFTNGNDIYFNQGKFSPNTESGKHLLAHELTHTIQQGASKNIRKQTEKKGPSFTSNITALSKSNEKNTTALHSYYNSGDTTVIQQFNPLDILSSVTDISEYLNISLPESPTEALELLISKMEDPYIMPFLIPIPGYFPALLALKSALAIIKAIEYVIENKEQIIAEIMGYIEGKLDTVQELVYEKLHDILGIVDERHFSIIWNVYMLPMLVHLKDNWQETIKNAIWEQIWPFEGLTSIMDPEPVGLGKNLAAIWKHIKGAFSNLKDLELSKAIDDILMIDKEILALTNRFYGWVAIAIIASETVAGAGGIGAITAGTGTLAGAAVGFGAGLATAGSLGEGLLIATIAVDLAIILKSIASLNDVDSMLVDDEKMIENSTYYERIAQSSISTGLMLALIALAYLGAEVAGAVLSKVAKFLPEGVLEIIEHVKFGMKNGRGGSGELEPPNVKKNPPELDAEFNLLREKVNNPENVKPVNDAELATKYDVEVSVGEHTYRRRIADGKWCRFSVPVCGLEIEGVNVPQGKNTPGVDVPGELQVGEQVTIPYQGTKRANVISIKKVKINGEEIKMYEFRILKDTRKGFENGSTFSVSEKTVLEWFAEKKIIRWSQERSRLMANRPAYQEGLVEKVWEASKSPDGKVRDPYDPSKELHWDKSRSRYDQWHMGHKRGHEYNKLVDQYVDGKITWEKFIEEYNNPKNYQAEDPIGNMGHGNEER